MAIAAAPSVVVVVAGAFGSLSHCCFPADFADPSGSASDAAYLDFALNSAKIDFQP